MNRQHLEKIIGDFDLHRFKRFFSEKNRQFRESSEGVDVSDEDRFSNGQKLGAIDFEDGTLIVCAVEALRELTERSGKKAQYELGKRILKSNQVDAGIFIFYDAAGAFRFSLIYANYLGKKRDWSSFRRFTYFVNSDQTNKTFSQRIGDLKLTSIEEVKRAFSVEPVTKEFYEAIANWYFWAVEKCRFPDDAEVEDSGRNIAVIRLITRMIFIWFMRERGLVPRDLFRKNKVETILKSISDEESTYYRAILQNLFFATLSTKQSDRKFRSEVRGHKGYNPDFGNHNVYRYHELFRTADEIEDYFGEIPFLNGGLFECLDDKARRIYIDGFTSVKKNQPDVPNSLFFSSGEKADLNRVYGTKGKTYRVRGLLDILHSFNFTIDENSPDDQDIALDPELLGRVFENLLASYNPETASTARKATGSYYTPREIVDYMITESLKAYFMTHMESVKDLHSKLDELFQAGSDTNPFSPQESSSIVSLIEQVRIVDPAVGSGAFPMGALNKLVYILSKLDPGNELWKKAQLKAANAIPDPRIRKDAKARIEEYFQSKNADYGRKLFLIQKCIYGVDIQEIAVEIAKLRFFISLLVDERIDDSMDNLGIEPLPNLDFKIMQGNSLVSEYMGVDFDNGRDGQGTIDVDQADNDLIREFEQKKIEFQNEPDKERKARLKDDIDDMLIQLFEAKLKKHKATYFQKLKSIQEKYSVLRDDSQREEMIAKDKRTLAKSESFDLDKFEAEISEMSRKNRTRPFFAWKLYFAEVFNQDQPGFDIAIANPPYVEHKKLKPISKTLKKHYDAYSGTADLYVYFYELSLKLLCGGGTLAFISSNKFMKTSYGERLRALLATQKIRAILDFTDVRVFEALVASCVIIASKARPDKEVTVSFVDERLESLSSLRQYIHDHNTRVSASSLTGDIWQLSSQQLLDVKARIESDSQSLRSIGGIEIYRGITTGYNPAFIIDQATKQVLIEEDGNSSEIIKPLLQGRNIRKWTYIPSNQYILQTGYKVDIKRAYPAVWRHLKRHADKLKVRADQGVNWWNLRACKYYNEFEKEKIIWGLTADKWAFAFDDKKHYLPSNGYILTSDSLDPKYILAILNSKLMQFYFGFIGIMTAGGAYTLKHETIREMPIKQISKSQQKPFVDRVDEILEIVSSPGNPSNRGSNERVLKLEKELDELVYKLYDLSTSEIEVVESETEHG